MAKARRYGLSDLNTLTVANYNSLRKRSSSSPRRLPRMRLLLSPRRRPRPRRNRPKRPSLRRLKSRR
jgi:hypothetical protein